MWSPIVSHHLGDEAKWMDLNDWLDKDFHSMKHSVLLKSSTFHSSSVCWKLLDSVIYQPCFFKDSKVRNNKNCRLLLFIFKTTEIYGCIICNQIKFWTLVWKKLLNSSTQIFSVIGWSFSNLTCPSYQLHWPFCLPVGNSTNCGKF